MCILIAEEKTSHVRTQTHTTIADDDPDRDELLKCGRWQAHRRVRFWIARFENSGVALSEYVGTFDEWNPRSLRRLIFNLNRVKNKRARVRLLRQLSRHLDLRHFSHIA